MSSEADKVQPSESAASFSACDAGGLVTLCERWYSQLCPAALPPLQPATLLSAVEDAMPFDGRTRRKQAETELEEKLTGFPSYSPLSYNKDWSG